MPNFIVKGFYGFFCLIIFLAGASQAQSQSINGAMCDGCAYSEKTSMAFDWTQTNISQAEAQSGVRKQYHIVDASEGTVTSFEVWKHPQTVTHLNPPRTVYIPRILESETPSDVESYAATLFSELADLDSAVASVTIPEEIIESPWEFVGCSSCANDVANFMRDSGVVGFGTMTSLRIQNALQFLGISNGTITKVWVVELESGGQVKIELTLVNGGDLLNVEVIQVIDSDNNIVPLQASGLNNILITVQSQAPADIDYYLFRFGYMTGEEVDGKVLIEECRRPHDQPDNTVPLCQ